jgi:hypothetical protein
MQFDCNGPTRQLGPVFQIPERRTNQGFFLRGHCKIIRLLRPYNTLFGIVRMADAWARAKFAMGNKNEFEQIFRDFVSAFGGEVLPEPSDTKIADYVFRKQNVVAELKCLMEDQTDAMNKKVTQVVQDWWTKHKKIPEGYDSSKPLEIATAPREIADGWMEILKAPIESFIRHANQQIRDTKQRLNMPEAKGLVLVFNQGNLLHNRPRDFTNLMKIILRKRDKEKERRFSHVHAGVYFSYETVRTEKEKMNFWASLQLYAPNEDVTPMETFLKELEQAWYAFVQKRWGKTVRQFSG